MTSLPLFSSVPGQTVPGMIDAARVGGATTTAGTAILTGAGTLTAAAVLAQYQFYGKVPLGYFDYVDTSTSEMLLVVPGGSYSMAVVTNRAGMTVPPPDGRWTLGGGMMLRRPRVKTMAEVRADVEKAKVARGHYEPGPPRGPVHAQGGARTMPPPPGPSQMQQARADLEKARVAHGHYAPGGCQQCMTGGQEGR